MNTSAAPEALFLYSGSSDAFAARQLTLRSLGSATQLGSDPGLASLYDAALFGMAWGALGGFYHAIALVGTEKVNPTTFASVATGHLSFITGLMVDHARQIEDGHYPDDDGTVEIHAAATDHLIHTSREQGISDDVPNLIKALLQRGIAAGHGVDGIASVIELIKKPSTG